MAQVVNTNIPSLNAQRNLMTSQMSLQTALQRLSSGLRINSAKDDAAGLAISDRMTAQIRGLNQAARNANDGISLAQTAEGALAAIGTSLQRMRELSVQSANSTNSASDRSALNAETQQLLAEIQRVAQTTQFNGLNLLDGSFSAQQFQVGANANQTISMSLTGATTTSLGAWGGTSASVLPTTVTNGAAPNAWTASSTISINGISIGASVADTTQAGWSAGSAAAKALAINAKSSQTGVNATASTSVAGSGPTANSSLANGGLTINGVNVGPIAAATTAVGQGQNAAAAINLISNQTGVTATYSTTSGALSLTASDGRDIKLQAGTATASGVAQVLNATGLKASDLNVGNAAATIGTSTVAFGAAAAVGNTVTINGVTFTYADAGAGNPDAYTVVDATHVTVSTDISAATAASSGTSLVNAFNAAKANTLTAAALAPLSAAGAATVTLTDTRAGLAATVGRTVAASTATVTLNATGSDGTLAGNAYETTGGTLSLSASQNFTLTGSGTGLADGGLGSFTSSLSQLSNVSIASLAGANLAITVIDATLSQVNSQRASLGAYQNRFEATVSSLAVSSENLSAARSRIQDADFAQETANLTRAQILQQAGVAMLAQANSLPNMVLSLLKG
ncbi:MAG: flagellin FliC [Proteobacteria bacterium]|nr:flagellin FliC [Pseudomonadota bacterium]HQR02819.1 flagellin [Rhodocyclaceae bacterium]